MRQTCESCVYFWRHYTRHGGRYYALAIGHCTTPRVKVRKLDTPACARYRGREETENASR